MTEELRRDREYSMTSRARGSKKKMTTKKKMVLGLGLDCEDGEKRVTIGKNFRLYGGKQETHECMQEKAIKLNEQLDKRGKTLDQVCRDEFDEIASEIGLVRVES